MNKAELIQKLEEMKTGRWQGEECRQDLLLIDIIKLVHQLDEPENTNALTDYDIELESEHYNTYMDFINDETITNSKESQE